MHLCLCSLTLTLLGAAVRETQLISDEQACVVLAAYDDIGAAGYADNYAAVEHCSLGLRTGWQMCSTVRSSIVV